MYSRTGHAWIVPPLTPHPARCVDREVTHSMIQYALILCDGLLVTPFPPTSQTSGDPRDIYYSHMIADINQDARSDLICSRFTFMRVKKKLFEIVCGVSSHIFKK